MNAISMARLMDRSKTAQCAVRRTFDGLLSSVLSFCAVPYLICVLSLGCLVHSIDQKCTCTPFRTAFTVTSRLKQCSYTVCDYNVRFWPTLHARDLYTQSGWQWMGTKVQAPIVCMQQIYNRCVKWPKTLFLNLPAVRWCG
jgi:hypothetical protein